MSFLDAFEGYDKPYRLTLKHPATGEPIYDNTRDLEKKVPGVAAYVDIYSENSLRSEEYKKRMFIDRKREAKKNNKPDPTWEEATAKGAEYYANLIAGWYLVNPVTGEGDADFDQEKAIAILGDRRATWLVDQIREGIADASNFLPAETSAKG